MPSFEETRAAARRVAGVAGSVAETIRSGAEARADQMREGFDRIDAANRQAQAQSQGIQLQAADRAYQSALAGGAAKARATEALGELANSLGNTFVVTARKVQAAAQDAAVADMKERARIETRRGVGDALTGAPRDPSAPKAYQDVYSQSSATLAASQDMADFVETLRGQTDPQAIRDAAHVFLTEKVQGLDDDIYREYYASEFLRQAIPAAEQREAAVVKEAQEHVLRTAVGSMLQRLPSMENVEQLFDAVDGVAITYPGADKNRARAYALSTLVKHAAETGRSRKLLALASAEREGGKSLAEMFPDAVMGIYADARAEDKLARQVMFQPEMQSLEKVVSRIEQNADLASPEIMQDLSQAMAMVASMERRGATGTDGFRGMTGRVVKAHAKLVKEYPDYQRYLDALRGIGDVDDAVLKKYGNETMKGLLAGLDEAREPDQRAALIGEIENFVAHTQFFPPALAGRLRGISATDPNDIQDPARAAQVFNQQAEALSIALNAVRRNPSMAATIRGDLDPTTAYMVREAERISRVEAVSAEDVLRRLHDEFPKEVRKGIAEFKMDDLKVRLRREAGTWGSDWSGHVSDLLSDIGGQAEDDPDIRAQIVRDFEDAVRWESRGVPADSVADVSSLMERAAERVASFYGDSAKVELPVIVDDGVERQGVFLSDRKVLKDLQRGAISGKYSAADVLDGHLTDLSIMWSHDEQFEMLRRGDELGPFAEGLSKEDFGVRPQANADGSLTVVTPAVLGWDRGVRIVAQTEEDDARLEIMNGKFMATERPFEWVNVGGNTYELRWRMDRRLMDLTEDKLLSEHEDRHKSTASPENVDEMLRYLDRRVRQPSPFSTQQDDTEIRGGTREDELRGDAVQGLGRGAIQSLQEMGMISPTVGLSKPLPRFGSLEGLAGFIDDQLDSYQLRANGGQPVDPMGTKMDSTYQARRNSFIKEHEGFRDSVYLDTNGYRTIGAGINLDDETTQKFMRQAGMDVDGILSGRKRMTRDQLDVLFDHKVAEAEKIVSNRIKVPLTANQRMVLVSMVFNTPGLLGPNLTGYVNTKDWANAEREIRQFSNRRKSKGIQNRRNAEADYFALDTHEPADPIIV